MSELRLLKKERSESDMRFHRSVSHAHHSPVVEAVIHKSLASTDGIQDRHRSTPGWFIASPWRGIRVPQVFMMSIMSRYVVVRSLVPAMLLLLCWIGQGPSAHAQGQPSSKSGGNSADVAHKNSRVLFSVESHSKLGAYPIVPDQWCDLHLRLENNGDSAHELLCTSYFEGDASLQYGRQLWLPPHARINVSHPALVPRAAQDKVAPINVSSLVMERGPEGDVLLRSESQQLRHDRTLLLTPHSRITGIVYGGGGKTTVPADVMDTVIACRVTQRLTNKVTVLANDFLPTDENSLRLFDHLVVLDDRLTDDYAALAAVRRWMHSGGRLWVMLDRVNAEFLERLLGDDFHGHVASRVSLTSLRIDGAPTFNHPEGEPGEPLTFDEPVEMARLVVTGMKVSNTVDGWPASLSMPYGEGRLFITTVGARAWIKPTPPESQAEMESQHKSAFVPRIPMQLLSTQILGNRESPLLVSSDVEALAREYISYKIPDWTFMAGAMSAFLVVLAVLGLLSWRLQRLEHFGWIASMLAAVVSAVFLGIGQSNRHAVPATESSVRLAQAIAGTDDVRSQGAVAIYRPDSTSESIQSRHGGIIGIDMKGMEGVTRRMITTDLQSFHWEGIPQSSGLQLFSETTSDANPERFEARATFDSKGLAGRFVSHGGGGEDMMLATRFGRIGLKMSGDGTLSGGTDEVLAADQYVVATFLGAEQERRRRILETLFAGKSWKNVVQRPQLLVWLKEWPQGFSFGDGLVRQGQTLLVLPIEFTRPPAGTDMAIPSPLISYGTRVPPDGKASTGCWDDNLGIWQERSSPCTTWLNFQIPRQLLPAKLSKVTVDIKATGAISRIGVLALREGSVVPVQELVNPVGAVQVDISDPSLLGLTDEGELTLGITAGDPSKVIDANMDKITTGATADYWKIESLRLNAWATTEDLSTKN